MDNYWLNRKEVTTFSVDGPSIAERLWPEAFKPKFRLVASCTYDCEINKGGVLETVIVPK